MFALSRCIWIPWFQCCTACVYSFPNPFIVWFHQCTTYVDDFQLDLKKTRSGRYYFFDFKTTPVAIVDEECPICFYYTPLVRLKGCAHRFCKDWAKAGGGEGGSVCQLSLIKV